MKLVPASVVAKVSKAALSLQKSSPKVLFVTGIVGFGATVVASSTATLKLEAVLDKTNDDLDKVHKASEKGGYSDADARHDKVVIYTRSAVKIAKLYAPAVILGALSITCLVKSHGILTRRNAALTSAYVALDQAYKKYRDNIRERLGEDVERELMFEGQPRKVAVDSPKGTKVETVTSFNTSDASPYARVFSLESSSEWSDEPTINETFLWSQQRWANDRLISRGYLFLNEIYKDLGFPPTQAGQIVGWVYDPNDPERDNFVSFGAPIGSPESSLRDFFYGPDGKILLDFNVDGVIYNLIGPKT